MRIALAQIDSIIGDFDGNTRKVIAYASAAGEQGADLVLFPELALCGYPPMDLLDQDSFTEGSIRALRLLQRELPGGIAVGIGYVSRNRTGKGKALTNTYGIVQDGQVLFEQEKTLLPTYDVFDEARYFESAEERKIFEFKGKRLGIAVCEDMWRESAGTSTHYAVDPIRELLDRGANILLVPSASPYYAHKLEQRLQLAKTICHRGSVPIVYINAVGANDSIIFDGRSFLLEPAEGTPRLRLKAKSFEEDLVIWDTDDTPKTAVQAKQGTGSGGQDMVQPADELDLIEAALVLGIRGYMQKCGFKRAHVGLSGGIDSALVAYLAVQAIGADQVLCFGLPSRFSSQGSKDDARELAHNLGCSYQLLPIEPAFEAYLETLAPVFSGRPFDLTEENLQARIRGTLLMAYSNKFDSLLLTTGNKSELAMGYCTLYGDMAGALAPIGDLFKIEVFALCRRINQRAVETGAKPIIPEAILIKPPSAELRPNQTDQDSLPPYEDLDQVLNLYLLENLSKNEIVQRGWPEDLVSRIIRTVAKAEYKRRQAPPVLKVSQRAFGMGRRMPIARSIYEG